MKQFKEWLSDNLRYLVLLLALILGIFAIVLGMRIYRNMVSGVYDQKPETEQVTEGTAVSISVEETEAVTEETEVLTEAVSEETEKESETETETEKETETETKAESETAVAESESRETSENETISSELRSQSDPANTADATGGTDNDVTISVVDNGGADTEGAGQTTLPSVPVQRETEEINTLQTLSETTMYASTDLNIRSGPGTQYRIISEASTGEPVTVTGETTSWYRVSTQSGTGYISKSLLADSYTPTYVTINSACYLRSWDDYGDNIISQLEAGTTVELVYDNGGWACVRVNGTEGYVGSKFIY